MPAHLVEPGQGQDGTWQVLPAQVDDPHALPRAQEVQLECDEPHQAAAAQCLPHTRVLGTEQPESFQGNLETSLRAALRSSELCSD